MAKAAKNIEADFLGDLEPLQNRKARAEMDRRRVSYQLVWRFRFDRIRFRPC